MRSRRHWQGASLGRSSRPRAGLVFLHAPGAGDRALRLHHRGPHLPVPAAGPHAALVRGSVRARGHLGRRCGCRWRVAPRRHAGSPSCSARWRPSRWRARTFRGKESITLLFVLPIALPGIITGIALLAGIRAVGLEPGFWTIVAGHATFCLVIVYNNVIARLRRIPPSWIEASMDLGADGWQTFRYVLLPQIATALLAGGMLAFALSFDEIIVTLFTAGHAADAADLVLQRAVPAARAADHQRRRRGRDPGDAACRSCSRTT